MNKEQPLVSVLMTAYNREKYIAEAIESVLASIYTNFELIIVDDCSKDKTVEIARSYEAEDSRLKVYVNEKNFGDYLNRNKAASYAKGKYLKYLDADDIIFPYGLKIMVDSMEMFPDAGWGASSISDGDRPMPVAISPIEIFKEHFLKRKYHFSRGPGSVIIRRTAFEEVGMFSGKRFVGDQELWLKLSCKFPMVKFQNDLSWDRVHVDQERNYENSDRSIEKLRSDIYVGVLLSNDCPLSQADIRLILKTMKISNAKKKIKLPLIFFRKLFNHFASCD